MALLKLGALAQDVRGSLAGTVFSRNRGGAYVREKVSPIQPLSPFSAITREVFRAVSQRWACVLTPGQRYDWDGWAEDHPVVNVFGDSIILGGIAAFQLINARLRQVNAGWLDDPPTDFTSEDLGICSITATVSGAVLTFSAAVGRVLVASEKLLVYVTAPLAPGRAVQAPDLRLVNLATRSGYDPATNIGASVQARFPNQVFAIAQRLAVRLIAIRLDQGATSAPVLLEATITAP